MSCTRWILGVVLVASNGFGQDALQDDTHAGLRTGARPVSGRATQR